jgi:hypothetical protein
LIPRPVSIAFGGTHADTAGWKPAPRRVLAGGGRIVEPGSNRFALLGGHRLGQDHTDLGFAGPDDAGSRPTQAGHVTKMSAADEDA